MKIDLSASRLNIRYRKGIESDRWLISSLLGMALLHLSSIWKTSHDIDLLTVNGTFWGAIIYLLWRKRDRLRYDSEPISTAIGLLLWGLILSKTLTLYRFEASLLSLFPFGMGISLALIASSFGGFRQYWRELFFAWFLFFPEGAIGNFIDGLVHITILNAKFATYLLYYLGFDVGSQGNRVMLSLPAGEFTAVVDYPCAGVPMILLMLKLALLLISFAPLAKSERWLIPSFSVALGFFMGVIRVCILTLLIPNPNKFAYWHGTAGSQIFSTLAITIFAGFCWWILSRRHRRPGKSQSIRNN